MPAPGLSHGTAKVFGREGFKATLVARNEEKLQNEVAQLKADGIEADYRVADLSNTETLTALLGEMNQAENMPDVILFNAFMPAAGGFAEETWESLKKEMDINVGAAFCILKEMLPVCQKQNRGALFFTGGGFGIYPTAEYLGVSMSKAALRNMVLAAAAQVKDSNVHVATATVLGYIGGPDPKYAPETIAENYWKLYCQQGEEQESEIVY